MADIPGTPGNDNLVGTNGNDSIQGFGGNDDIKGRDGLDTIHGGAGLDTIDAGRGDDWVDGGDDADLIDGGSGNDTIFGGGGNDELIGFSGDDQIDGGEGDDTIDAGSGHDSVTGGEGADHIDGGSGNDTMAGGDGNDTIIGGSGMDTALFEGDIGDFLISLSGTSRTVADQQGSEGTDTVADDVEFMQFGDGHILEFKSKADNAPIALNPNATANEDTGGNFTLTVADLEGQVASIDSITVTGGGFISDGPGAPNLGYGGLGAATDFNIQFNSNGLYETLAEGATTEETITVTVSDIFGNVRTQDFTLVIEGENDAPVAQNDTFSGDEDTQILGNVLLDNGFGADSDVDIGDTLSVVAAVINTANGGTVNLLADGSFTYDPAPDYFGPDSFDYTLTDGDLTDTGTVNITVNPVNDAPVAQDDSFTGPEDIVINGNVLADNGNGPDSDIENDPLSVVAGTFATAQGGSVTIAADGSFTYTPALNYFGPDSFDYTLSDGDLTDTGTVNINLTPVNDAPIALAPDNPAITVEEANGQAAINLNLRVSDPDGDNVGITFARFIDPNTGTEIPISASLVNGVLSFNPADFGLGAGQSQVVRVQYRAVDDSGQPNNSTLGLVEVTIVGSDPGDPPVNQAPVADDTAVSANEANGDIVLDLTDFTSDPDGDALQVVSILDSEGGEVNFSQNGTLLTIGLQQFGLSADEQDVFDLTYVVDDGSSAANSQDSGVITLTLDGVDDPTTENTAPSASPVVVNANEVDGLIVIDLNDSISDPDGDALNIVQVTDDGGTGVTLNLDGNVLIIDPAEFGLDDEQNGIFTFTYTVDDGTDSANSSATAEITINLAGFTEDPPPEPEVEVILDFEPFANPNENGLTISIETYEGFVFYGQAIVVETDEIAGGGRNPGGLVNGQTTVPGDNVLVGTVLTELVPVLDESGEPVLDERGEPVTETVVVDGFGIGGRNSTFNSDDLGILFASTTSGQTFELPEELPEGVGETFSLESLSLNVPQNDGVTVTLTTYTLEIVEVASETAGFSNYYYQYVPIDSFDFLVDASTGASLLDFNTATATIDPAAFDNIYHVGLSASDGNGVVLDDVNILV